MLIDGGIMNNVPADVVKAMGADRVVAVNVGDLSDREGVSYTMFGLAGNTLDAMMRASTKRHSPRRMSWSMSLLKSTDRSTGGGPPS